jgi:hypothetical protein
MRENVLLFDEVIKRAESRMALYMTWARQKSPQAQQAISNAYTSIAKETAAVLIPAGNAWREFLKKYKTPVLHDRDGSHPTLAGSFLAACVIFRTLFQQQISPAKLSIDGLDANEITRLASIASRCV